MTNKKMNTKTTKKNSALTVISNHKETIALVGAAVATVAAGTFFFFGSKGKKHRKAVKGWMLRMRAEIVERLESAKELTEPLYHEIVDSVAKSHIGEGKIPKEEVLTVAQDLKKQWKSIRALLPGSKKSKIKASKAKRTTRKA